jgi:hypothetical protein
MPTPSGSTQTATGRATAEPAYAADSPAGTVLRLHACRVEGRYAEMLELLTPENREEVRDLVLAVDQLIAAEMTLRRKLVKELGEGSATRFNQRDQVANILGPFSRDIRIVDEKISGDSAEVSLQVAARVPLETVKLVGGDGGAWRVKVDEPIDGLSGEIRNLAKATDKVAAELERRHLSLEEVEKELNLRQAPILKRMALIIDQ